MEGIPLPGQQRQLVDGDGAGLTLHLPALPGEVTQLLAVDLQRGIHGRDLHDLPPEAFQHLGKLFLCHADLPAGKYRAGGILGIGGDAQKQLRFVGLFGVFKKLYAPGAAPHKHGQHTGSHGVQRTAVADAPGAEHPPQPRRHVLTRPPGGLVDNHNSVHFSSLLT